MIHGFFSPSIRAQPNVRAGVMIPDVRAEWVLVPFIVDTGAAVTCLHALDAIRLFGFEPEQLDPARWEQPTYLAGITGGLAYREYPAQYAFLHDDGSWEIVDSVIHVGERRSQRTPALLGCDLLKHFTLTVSAGTSITLGPAR